LQISLKGKGITILLLSLIPCVIDATAHALLGMALFDMPIEVSYCMGFATSPVATIIVVGAVLRLSGLGYGTSKGIDTTIIPACTFDNIVSLIAFGICRALTFQIAATNKNLGNGGSAGLSIGFLFVQVIVGVLAGGLFGLCGYAFKYLEKHSWSIYLKLAYCIVIGLTFIIGSE